MKKSIEIVEECPSCGGTGLYVGMGERDGAAVVCNKCAGTGRHLFRHEYEDFTCRKELPGVVRVYETNPGICIGTGRGHTLQEFGGLSLADWKAGKPFGPGTENRRYTCPAWWYQCADYKRKPDWRECGLCFPDCSHFGSKDKCWQRFDAEGL